MISNRNYLKTVTEFAAFAKVKNPTVFEWIKKGKIQSTVMGGTKYVLMRNEFELFQKEHGTDAIGMARAEWVPKLAKQHGVAPRTLYEYIILGKIDAMTIGNKIFVDAEAPAVIAFFEERKKKYKRKPRKY